MKRKLTLFLSAVMATSCLPMTAYAANFKDINDVAWAASTINSVADKGLLSGYEDGTFRGKNNVTYPEAMLMIYNALVKSGSVDPIDAVTAYSYVPVLNTYKVPAWSQMAVAYGLEYNLITMQDVATKFAGGNKAAIREDVAVIFGNALALDYSISRDLEEVTKFSDVIRISKEAMPLVDLLKRLGIVNGDNFNCFNPKNNINRAEMAVMLNKTFSVLTEGVGSTGVITEVSNNDGKYFFINVEFDNGSKQGFHATTDGVKVYDGNGKSMTLNRLAVGDSVRLVHAGDRLSEVHIMDAVSVQARYDVTGFISSFDENILRLENENTGETNKYLIDNDCICYLEGVKIKRNDLRDTLKERIKEIAYAGLVTETEREKDQSTGQYGYVTEVTELHVTFEEAFTKTGKVDTINDKSVRFKPEGASKMEVYFADNCEFYIADEKVSVDALQDLAAEGTTYVKVKLNDKEKATEVIMSEDTFHEGGKDDLKDQVMKLADLTDNDIELENGSKNYTYRFGSQNPLENIRFYLWEKDEDDDDGDWDDMKAEKMISYVEKELEDGNNLYCRLTFNSGGKITTIEVADRKSAWAADEVKDERKGTVASVEDGILKFKTSTKEYKMLNQYNTTYKDSDKVVTGKDADGKKVSNPLVVESAYTSSMKVFNRMANDDDMELYAEIIADSDDQVQSITARLTKAEGKLVEINRSEKFIKIETGDGEYKLNMLRTPKLVGEDDYFELEDIEGVGYVGEKLILGFNTNGTVDEIEVADGPRNTDGSTRVKGIATAANDGLEVEGVKGTFRWLSKTSNINITNYSTSSDSLSEVKKLIEDPNVEVYVDAMLDDKERVEGIKVYVRSAEGELDDDGFGNYLRINTEDNTFSFKMKTSIKIDVDDYDKDDLEKGKADGMDVVVTFSDDGRAEKIEEA